MRKKLKVGDEVFDVTAPETRAIVTKCTPNGFYVMFGDGSCGEEDVSLFIRTGRRFKIKKMLKELD